MTTNMSDFSDLEDADLEELLDTKVNRCVQTSVIRHPLLVQRDLTGKVLEGEKRYYEEIKTTVTYKPTHHQLCYDQLNSFIYPTNYEVRDYQYEIVKRALFENVLCAIPTGMGKTFIASTVMLNYFRWTKNAKIIFTAPTRPLVAQQIKACLGVTGIPYNQTAILLDKSRKHREQIWAEKRVFFATPQVIENDLKRGVLNPKDIVLVVIDEAHRARGSYAYVEVTKFIERFNTSYRMLALTATPATDIEGVQEVVENLQISKIEIRTEESEDIVKYMKRRDYEKVNVPFTSEIEDIIEQIGIAATPVLKEAVQLGLYDDCEPVNINAYVAMQQSQRLISNSSIPEGVKWKNYFTLQLLSHVGHMLKRLKIYGIRTFYSYFDNKYREFTTKCELGKSKNKTAQSFYSSPILKNVIKTCQRYLSVPEFLGHGKLQCVRNELSTFFVNVNADSRVIIFTELRESALEIVKCIDDMNDKSFRPHIFIGQARGKEGFDQTEYIRKYTPKGRTKADRFRRIDEERQIQEEKMKKKEEEKLLRSSRRTGSSEEAQITGMSQKQQKEVISKFKKGEYNVLVCTSIGEEGLDIGEVDMIICYDTTSSPIKNIQRMGRTGRKRDGRIVLLLSDNESNKFEKAMEDYAQLQRLIGQGSINYKVADRIIPANMNPKCQKEFITVSATNNEVNEMEDTDAVIKFATQAMLGKLDNKKTGKKKVTKATPKRFFMPDNVEHGIVPAVNLVNRYDIRENGEYELAEKSTNKKKLTNVPKGQHTLLDRLEHDSLESDMSSPEMASQNLIVDIKPKLLSDILMKQDITLGADQIPSSYDSEILNPDTTMVFDTKHLEFPSKRSLDTDDPPQLLKKQKADKNAFIDKETTYKNTFNKSDGLLTPSEKKYFEENYSSVNLVSWEPKPLFSHPKLKVYKIPHCERVRSIISVFDAMNNDDKEQIIEMHRKNAIARRVEHQLATETNEPTHRAVIVSNHDIRLISQELEFEETCDRSEIDVLDDDGGLSDLLCI
ncbi:3'-5' DNA helicase Ecym_4473 [Eremothecium cymbalariae DBVPG|uniref:ATP-dependent DNA helicase n=1 Tax=Eremothecium cymbalariae (strain CBS 270.75 / DBVPG 7215 / KCTC 17166 / NRRL Y-17582) TaxID=931890 RepID=G8JU10_ERECY|nr:hypothetical protein Ecym_4473 [Eremothecium cymbalariae DBVPG\